MKKVVLAHLFFVVVLTVVITSLGCHNASDNYTSKPYTPMTSRPAEPSAPTVRSTGTPRAADAMQRDSLPAANPVTREVVADGKVRTEFAFPTGHPETSVMLIQREAPAEVRLGTPFEYLITVTNLLNEPLPAVQITEPYAATFRFDRAVPAPSRTEPGLLVWDLGDLPARQSRTIRVSGSASAVGPLRDCLTVSYKPSTCLALNVVEPKLKLVKSGPGQVLLCDPIAYTLEVTNQGTGVAQNVLIQDTLPAGLTTADGQDSYLVNVGDLPPGQTRQYKVNVKAAKTGRYENQAVATATGELKSTATHAVTVQQPVLTVTKTGPQTRYVGKSAEYVITVSNKGDGPARDTVIVDTLPAGMQFVSASDQGVHQAGQVTWQVGTLGPGASKQVSIRAMASRIGTQRNVVQATAYCAQGTAETTIEVVGIPAILLEVVDLEDPIEVGTNETYVIEVTNQGSATGTNIKVTCTIPDEQRYVSGSGPTPAGVDGKIVRFAPLASLAPQAKAVYRVVVKGNQPGDVRFKVELISDQMTSPVNETESTHQYE